MALSLHVRQSKILALHAVDVTNENLIEKGVMTPIATNLRKHKLAWTSKNKRQRIQVNSQLSISDSSVWYHLFDSRCRFRLIASKLLLPSKKVPMESQKHTLVINKNLSLWVAILATIGTQSVLLDIHYGASFEDENQLKHFETYMYLSVVCVCICMYSSI